MDDRAGLSWRWSRFGLGILFAVPAMAVAPFDLSLAVAFGIGVVPAAAFGLPPRRRDRAIIPLVGALSALALLLGSVLAAIPVVAVVAVFGLAVLASENATRGRWAQLVLVLALPMTGIGLSFTWSTVTLGFAACIVAGSVYAWLLTLLWPERDEQPHPAPPVPRGRAMLVYGILLGAAAATAATLGFLLDLEHVGWATGAVLLVMRPVRGQLIARSIGRAASVLVGALAAAIVAVLSPADVVVGILVGLVIGSACAIQESRWYVVPGFTTFLALTLIMSTSPEPPAERFLERAVETLIGVGLALFFGAVVPSIVSLIVRNRRRSTV
ncbi:FUSC family protein [Microbacterium sp. NPDC091662]|uniref:FUSC family protein n=1 Tax=Microbacterium sp. NPDC091662 TaxID=3364211 RepID=UPI0037F403B6